MKQINNIKEQSEKTQSKHPTTIRNTHQQSTTTENNQQQSTTIKHTQQQST